MVPSSSPNRLHTLCSRSFVLVATVFLVSVTCMAVAPRKIHGDSSSSSLRSIDKQTTDKLFHAKMPRVIVQNRSSNTSTGQDSAVERQRWLVEPHNFFAPLTCNANPCSAKTSNWTLEDYNPEAGTVVIPCGHCITFDGFLGNDLDDPTSLANYFTRHYQNTTTMGAGQSRNITLVLPHGLDIQGWLDIPVGSSAAVHDSNKSSNSYLTIVTPFIRVQGKLSLHVQGSTVGGMPNVRIILTDDDDAATTSFVPEENNAFACSNSTLESEPSRCQVGPKSIVVAGGQLDIRGMADHCSTWVRLYNVIGRTNGTGQSDLIVRDTNGIMGCWGRGSEILITSHSTDFESAQTRRLLTDPERYGEGLIRLRLDADIVPTVTELHNDGFAVEVALLSRNILFEGARDASDSLLGAHLMVMNTPVVKQLIQGVEFRNFGRQGTIRFSLLRVEMLTF